MATFPGDAHGSAYRAAAIPDRSSGDRSLTGVDYSPLERSGAYKAAGRHTARVRFLRRAFILGAVFTISIISIVAAFDPFRHLPKSVSIGGVGVKGTKITMDSPKISGVQQGGAPYDIAAKTGIQDVTTPRVIELLGVDAHVGMSDATTTHVVSRHGVYDGDEDTMALDGDVKIANSSGYTFGLKSANIDFKRGILSSEQRMRVDIKGGYVLSDAMTISKGGDLIAFRGHIESMFETPDEEPDSVATAAKRDETVQ